MTTDEPSVLFPNGYLDAAKFNTHTYSFPKYVGYWKMPNASVTFSTETKPSWIHRTSMRLLLGWTWSAND